MPENQTPPPSRLEKILAAFVAGVIGTSLIAFFAIIIATWSGMQQEEFSLGIWPTINLLTLYGLPLGFLVIIALLIVSTRRRRGQGGHGTS